MGSEGSLYIMYGHPEARRQGHDDDRESLNPRTHRSRDGTRKLLSWSLEDNELLVITAKLGNGVVKRILIDTGEDSNIFRNTFDALGFQDHHPKPYLSGVVGLGDHYIKSDGTTDLLVTFG
ncbi:hypothetical protein PIB30_006374 [Stylosanthes scabra]|uniref:Peptidase A2 domain-containing protein n=1 Tax=Stylosanthes scabra TaxID=79078 RepID=A0ABU6S3S0_9FABA|nr:hypothetical protein [Stylosanthes scabra]